MKYCLSARQNKKYLAQAEEISVDFRDHRVVSEFFVDFPKANIILDVPTEELTDELKETLILYNQSSENFYCKIYNLKEALWFKENNIKFFYGYPVNTFYDVDGLIELGVSYIKIAAPLTFQMTRLSMLLTDVKFRMVPNVAYDAYIPRRNGIYGQWVRPEDVQYYEKGIDVFDFENCDLEQERALYDVYTRGEWMGNLNILITNLNQNADNRALPEELGKYRSDCGQSCMMDGRCRLCESAFNFEKAVRQERDRRRLEEMKNAEKEE